MAPILLRSFGTATIEAWLSFVVAVVFIDVLPPPTELGPEGHSYATEPKQWRGTDGGG
jgi:hypothetical protein